LKFSRRPLSRGGGEEEKSKPNEERTGEKQVVENETRKERMEKRDRREDSIVIEAAFAFTAR
jgi:hypothetical protein